MPPPTTPTLLTKTHKFHLRPATPTDIPPLNTMISHSVQTLHAPFYTPEIISSAMKYIYAVEPKLIENGTYFVVEAFLRGEGDDGVEKEGEKEGKGDGGEKYGAGEIVAAGAYSIPTTTTPQTTTTPPSPPPTSATSPSPSTSPPLPSPPLPHTSHLRALYIHPSFTRLGLAHLMVKHCEAQVKKNPGTWKMEFGATYAGVAFYEKEGYKRVEEDIGKGGVGRIDKVMGDGRVLELVRMGRVLD